MDGEHQNSISGNGWWVDESFFFPQAFAQIPMQGVLWNLGHPFIATGVGTVGVSFSNLVFLLPYTLLELSSLRICIDRDVFRQFCLRRVSN